MVGVVSALYALFGVVFVLGYVPQVRSVWRSRNGAADVSLPTWGLWCASASVSLLYAHFVSRDFNYTLVCLGNVMGCYAVTSAVWLKRRGGAGLVVVTRAWRHFRRVVLLARRGFGFA